MRFTGPLLRARWRIGALGALALSALALTGGRGPQGLKADGAGRAAGASECARCHPDLHARWLASTHALTFVEAIPEALPVEIRDGAEVLHPPGRTRFVREGDRLWALTQGGDGAPGRFPVTHQVGRTRMHMFVTTLPDGRMQVLPAMREHAAPVWYDYTALYFAGPGTDPALPPEVRPGDPSFWTGPVRSWDAQCSRCHVSGRAVSEPSGAGPRVRHRALGLDCEACHGASAEHAEYQDQSREDGDPILRLRDLPRRQQVDACLVCHMESEEIQPGWRPGDSRDLLDLLDPSLLDDKDRVDPAGRPLELVYAGVSFWSSRCAEQGGLTCSTCHDPHGGAQHAAMKGEPQGDGQCASCHAAIAADARAHTHHDPAGPGARCVACHMPKLSVERGHGAVTDHTISIPRPALVSDRVAADACLTCHAGLRGAPAGAPPLTEPTLRQAHARWWPKAQSPPAWLSALARGRVGAWDAVTRLNVLLDDPGSPRFARATAAVLLARLGDGARAGLLIRAADPDSLVRRRVADALPFVAGLPAWRALVALLDDPSPAVQAHAARAALLAPAGLLGDPAALARVVAQLERETRWAPDDDLRWERLARGLNLAGDAQRAHAARERQLALDPDNAALRARVEALRPR